jgi:hypothetical protein
MNLRSIYRSAAMGTIGLALAGCATNAGNGALIGGATGAGIGAALSRGHPGGIIVGGALGAVTGAIVGHEVDRDEAYRDGYYSGGRYYYYDAPPPGPVTETRTTYRNPDGTTTTYIDRTYGY